ncbi:Aspartic protease pep1 [Talaromyces atroroseus]|uniref:Aspartic protease pep1 n=1 Tax=Talaromyces atroroseus TaxID=1441469 RepID=A0A225ARN7_TALAT|nr:Aspartic protease pep1 [Talaromyces atroroseus]OKL57616.1 Aspartic protease pep1 [Talaromyces atroroseus]
MSQTLFLLLSASFAVAAIAAPTATNQTAKSFSIGQIAVPKNQSSSPASYLAKAYRKYGVAVPSNVASAAALGATGSVSATSYEEVEYVIPVTVGESQLTLDLDTGSSDLWVYSSKTPALERLGHAYYTPGSTATLMVGYSFDIEYGTPGDETYAEGDVYQDIVTVGGISYTKQAVEAVTSLSESFTADLSNDGLIGLAFSSLNTVSPVAQNTWFTNVQSSLALPLFAAYLRDGAPGTYDFGYIDETKYTGALTYTSVDTDPGYWKFTADGYAIGGQEVVGSVEGIADDLLVAAYYAQVPGATDDEAAGGYIYSCDTILPDFAIIVNGYAATVPGDIINFENLGDGSCYGGIQSNGGIGFAIFGDVFLKTQYVVFDAAGPQIGFAAQT